MAMYQISVWVSEQFQRLFMYSFTRIVRRQRLKTPQASRTLQFVCSKQNRASAPFIHTDTQNMQGPMFVCLKSYGPMFVLLINSISPAKS